MKLIVLMSTYHGEKYLREQLDSLLAQEHMPDKIVVRDDGSSDGTLTILEEYRARDSRIEYRKGENRGPAGSFYELIRDCEDAEYYALCDQDDVWMPDKLSAAVEALKKEDESIPLLYCSRYTLTDEKLNPIDSNVSPLYNYSDFPHSLIYHTAPGCTFVFKGLYATAKDCLYSILPKKVRKKAVGVPVDVMAFEDDRGYALFFAGFPDVVDSRKRKLRI